MMIDLGLMVARFLHYAATTTLAGVSFFSLYAYPGFEPAILARWRTKVMLAAAVVTLLSGFSWFALTVASMSGDPADVGDSEIVLSVIRDTSFGVVWTVRMVIAVVIFAVVVIRRSSTATITSDRITSFIAAALLVSLAGTGHSQIEQGWDGVVHVGSDAVHLLAAGAWLGGLVPLGYILLLHSREGEPMYSGDLNTVLMRFSGMGYLAVTTLIGSGLINAWFLVGNISSLFVTPYGQLLTLKLILFVGMLLLAISNRFWLVPSLTKVGANEQIGSTEPGRKLLNHVLAEQCLGVGIFLIVSVLGTMQPAIDR